MISASADEQRAKYEIGLDGDDIHWDEIDEDIHISSFFEPVEQILNTIRQIGREMASI